MIYYDLESKNDLIQQEGFTRPLSKAKLVHRCEFMDESGRRCSNKVACPICNHCTRDCPLHRNLTPKVRAYLDNWHSQDLVGEPT